MTNKEQQIARRNQRRMEQRRQNGMWDALLAEIARQDDSPEASSTR